MSWLISAWHTYFWATRTVSAFLSGLSSLSKREAEQGCKLLGRWYPAAAGQTRSTTCSHCPRITQERIVWLKGQGGYFRGYFGSVYAARHPPQLTLHTSYLEECNNWKDYWWKRTISMRQKKSVTMPNVFSMQKKGTVLHKHENGRWLCLNPIPWQITVSM